MAFHYVPKFKPVYVMLLSPDASRLELIENDNEAHRFTVQEIQSNPKMYKEKWHPFYQTWLSSETNLYLNKEKNILGISEICRKNGSKFLMIDVNDITVKDLARDLDHVGCETSIDLANKFLDKTN
jgi:hypothetical protein